jgi:hypothetical protein
MTPNIYASIFVDSNTAGVVFGNVMRHCFAIN